MIRAQIPCPCYFDEELLCFPEPLDWSPTTKPLDELYDLEDQTGNVFNAIRKSDGREVVIKRMFFPHGLRMRGCSRPVPTEVALMLILRRPPVCPYILQMYEWSDEESWISLEYPQPCVTLREFIRDSSEGLTEPVARRLMRQLVLAKQHCTNRGVFHGGFWEDNILVNTNTLELKLISFGRGRVFNNAGDEYVRWSDREYPLSPRRASLEPIAVESLGDTLYRMITNKEPHCFSEEDIKEACHHAWRAGVSEACCDLIHKCLKCQPTLEEILQHEWLQLDQ